MVKHPGELSVVECVTILRRSVGEWNRLRVAHPYWRANLWRADLGGANLGGANLGGADLWRADLGGANLGGANLGGADLWRADLEGANLRGANLRDADLRRADLRGADLEGANLRGANLRDANLWGATIGDHQLTGRTSFIGECAGYEVRLFATKDGHVLQAGCWTGTLDEAVERALEERGDDLTRVEVEAVVAHGRALLKAWEARGG